MLRSEALTLVAPHLVSFPRFTLPFGRTCALHRATRFHRRRLLGATSSLGPTP